MGKILNISLPPIKTCNNKIDCNKKCYALKSYKQFPAVKIAWDKNLKILKRNKDKYFYNIAKIISKKKPKYFRWHVAGDIINQNYYDNMVVIAELFPKTKFLVFTKQYLLNYKKRTPNLNVIISAWINSEVINTYNLQVAWVQDGKETRIPKKAIHCPGNCDKCLVCFNTKANKDVYFTIH